MIVVPFKVRCAPERFAEASEAFASVVGPSREVEGVISFDIARDLVDPFSIVATEVFADESALHRQEALEEVRAVIDLPPHVLAADPEATIFEVASSRPWGG